ncbi:MAG: hypothetical protein KHX13_04910 [Acidaminococcus intestini]|uniref:Uncharacterized protein n=1 Tax=Acidaminococcus intestini TaxID=187327 RepID=A0A943ECH9_9FIRM|nr:hypothetical protein [Acidaminococcus intestini]
MNDLIIEILKTTLTMLIGSLIGYCYGYYIGLRAVRKGMQLLLRISLNKMYEAFHHILPTADEKRLFDEMFTVYESLADNGVMDAKHREVLFMRERL